MSDRIDFGGRPWHAIPREILRDERLSLRARGALVTLLSHEEGWIRSSISTLMREARCGRDAAKSAMAELREAGYAELVTDRNEQGQLRRHYVIFAEPRRSQLSFSESPGDGKPIGRETHRTGRPLNEVEALDVDTLDVDTQDLRATRERNELFDTLAEIEGSNPSELTRGRAATIGTALAEIKRAAPDVTPEELRRRASIYRDVMPPGTTLTAPALATHWARCGTVPARITGPGARTARRFGLIDEETG